jgi:hypothetical protein
MSGTPWVRRPVPDLAGRATRVWHWELRSSSDLTLARMSFRAELLSGPGGARTNRDDLDLLLLAFEELASNGLRHGRPPVTVTVTATPTGWLIDVSDSDATALPLPRSTETPPTAAWGCIWSSG